EKDVARAYRQGCRGDIGIHEGDSGAGVVPVGGVELAVSNTRNPRSPHVVPPNSTPLEEHAKFPKRHLMPLTGESWEAGTTDEEFLHQPMLDITLLRNQSLQRHDKLIRIVKCVTNRLLFRLRRYGQFIS